MIKNPRHARMKAGVLSFMAIGQIAREAQTEDAKQLPAGTAVCGLPW